MALGREAGLQGCNDVVKGQGVKAGKDEGHDLGVGFDPCRDTALAPIQHMQKAPMEMKLQLHHVVSDITGATGMRIIRAIVAGERDPDGLAAFRDIRRLFSIEVIKAALVGNDRDERIFALTQSLDLYDVHQVKIEDCGRTLEAAVAALTVRADGDIPALPKARTQAQAGQCAFVRCACRPLWRSGHGPRADPRTWPIAGTEAGRRMRRGPEGLEKRQALHLVAMSGLRQQDIRWQVAVIPHPAFIQ